MNKSTRYIITLKVLVDAESENDAHETATRLCDTIGRGKRGEVRDIYADTVRPAKTAATEPEAEEDWS